MRLSGTGLACVRGGQAVFAGLAFAVAGGEALVVTGPNGAGKTTLLRAIAGLLRFAGGELAFDGGAPDGGIGEQAHYIGHQDAQKPALSVAENLAFWAHYLCGTRVPVEPALERVGLAPLAALPAAYLSAGQRRRLSIARLLAVARPIWLLDEPTAALDAAAEATLAEIMGAHLAGGGIIVAASHAPLPLAPQSELRLAGPPV